MYFLVYQLHAVYIKVHCFFFVFIIRGVSDHINLYIHNGVYKLVNKCKNDMVSLCLRKYLCKSWCTCGKNEGISLWLRNCTTIVNVRIVVHSLIVNVYMIVHRQYLYICRSTCEHNCLPKFDSK